jgi:hypothetical protein
MKIEFRPDINLHLDFKAIWPGLKGAFKGLKFDPKNYPQLLRKVLRILSWALVLIACAIAAIKLLA